MLQFENVTAGAKRARGLSVPCLRTACESTTISTKNFGHTHAHRMDPVSHLRPGPGHQHLSLDRPSSSNLLTCTRAHPASDAGQSMPQSRPRRRAYLHRPHDLLRPLPAPLPLAPTCCMLRPHAPSAAPGCPALPHPRAHISLPFTSLSPPGARYRLH